MHLRVTIVAVVLALATACQSFEGGARESFSTGNTCPADRVEVRARGDVKYSATLPRREPPADIKADPGRLKMWEEQEAKSTRAQDDACEMYEARGCGKQSLLCCRRPPKHVNRVSCMTRDYPAGVSRW